MTEADTSLSPGGMPEKIRILQTSVNQMAHIQQAMMEEIEKNKISIKALTRTIVTLTSHIERLQAGPAGVCPASAPANIKAKAEGTHASANITFQDGSVSTESVPISSGSVPETVSPTESPNEAKIPPAPSTPSRKPLEISRCPSSSSSALTALQSSLGAASNRGGSTTPSDQPLPPPVTRHAGKSKVPVEKPAIVSGSVSSEATAARISTVALPKSAKRCLNQHKKMQGPVVTQPTQTRFGRTSRPRERYDPSTSPALLPTAREDLLNSDLKPKTEETTSQLVPGISTRKRRKMVVEVVMISTSRSDAEKLAVPRLLDLEFPCGDEAAEVEAMLEYEGTETRASTQTPSCIGSPHDVLPPEVPSEFVLPNSDATNALEGSMSDLTDLSDDDGADDRSSNFSRMYTDEPEAPPFVVPEPREHPDSEYRPDAGSAMEEGPSGSSPDITTHPASSHPRSPELPRPATEPSAVTNPERASPPPISPSPSYPCFKHEAVDHKAHVVPADGVRRRLQGYAPYLVDLAPRVRDVSITRKHFSSIYGGSAYALYPPISPHKRAETGYEDFLFPTRAMNPHLPAMPGQPGLLCRTMNVSPCGDTVVKLLTTTGYNNGMWRYMGEYVLERAEPLSSDDWRQLPEKTKEKWVGSLLTSKKLFNKEVCARITLRRRLEREPTEDEVAKLVKQPVNVWCPSKEQVHAAYVAGEERIRIWVLHCVGYDEAFQRHLASQYSRAVTEDAAPDRSRARRTRGGAGEDDDERPKKKQRTSSTKSPLLQTGKSNKVEGVTTPKKRGRPPKLHNTHSSSSLESAIISTKAETEAKLASERESGAPYPSSITLDVSCPNSLSIQRPFFTTL